MDDQYSTHQNPMLPLSPTIRIIGAHWFNLPEIEEGDWPNPVGLLVGEQPRPGGNPKLPLWPWPEKGSGGRLFAMSGMHMVDYLRLLARVNIARRPVARWNPIGARQRALDMLVTLPDGARVVACGSRARDALGIGTWFTPQKAFLDSERVMMVAIPHPSGKNREYNTQAARRQTGQWIRWAARVGEES